MSWASCPELDLATVLLTTANPVDQSLLRYGLFDQPDRPPAFGGHPALEFSLTLRFPAEARVPPLWPEQTLAALPQALPAARRTFRPGLPFVFSRSRLVTAHGRVCSHEARFGEGSNLAEPLPSLTFFYSSGAALAATSPVGALSREGRLRLNRVQQPKRLSQSAPSPFRRQRRLVARILPALRGAPLQF